MIFLAVNLLCLGAGAILALTGNPVQGAWWPYPVVMGLWGLYVAVQGYRAYHEPVYPEEQIQREMKQL